MLGLFFNYIGLSRVNVFVLIGNNQRLGLFQVIELQVASCVLLVVKTVLASIRC